MSDHDRQKFVFKVIPNLISAVILTNDLLFSDHYLSLNI